MLILHGGPWFHHNRIHAVWKIEKLKIKFTICMNFDVYRIGKCSFNAQNKQQINEPNDDSCLDGLAKNVQRKKKNKSGTTSSNLSGNSRNRFEFDQSMSAGWHAALKFQRHIYISIVQIASDACNSIE